MRYREQPKRVISRPFSAELVSRSGEWEQLPGIGGYRPTIFMNKVWSIRINRLVIQFASEELALKWKRPEGLSGKAYMFLAPKNGKHDFITE